MAHQVGEYVLGPAQHVKDPSTGKEMHWDPDSRTLWFESAEPDSKLNRLALDPLG